MHPVLRRYVNAAVTSASKGESTEAALALWQLAELTYEPMTVGDEPDYYDRLVPEDLRALDLTEEEWQTFRRELLDIIATLEESSVRGQLIMAATVARRWDAVDTVVRLLHDHRHEYTAGQVQSLLISLDKVLDILSPSTRGSQSNADHELGRRIAHVEAVLRKFEVRTMLDELAAANDWRLAEQARNVRSRLMTLTAE